MPSVGPMEILLVLVIALFVFGPNRLPELGKQLGRSIREFRNAARNLSREMGVEDLGEDLKGLRDARGKLGETMRRELGLDELGEFPALPTDVEPDAAAATASPPPVASPPQEPVAADPVPAEGHAASADGSAAPTPSEPA
jgi:sec-independent protein translocase protein TatA